MPLSYNPCAPGPAPTERLWSHDPKNPTATQKFYDCASAPSLFEYLATKGNSVYYPKRLRIRTGPLQKGGQIEMQLDDASWWRSPGAGQPFVQVSSPGKNAPPPPPPKSPCQQQCAAHGGCSFSDATYLLCKDGALFTKQADGSYAQGTLNLGAPAEKKKPTTLNYKPTLNGAKMKLFAPPSLTGSCPKGTVWSECAGECLGDGDLGMCPPKMAWSPKKGRCVACKV
jgi:hypothetical protein